MKSYYTEVKPIPTTRYCGSRPRCHFLWLSVLCLLGLLPEPSHANAARAQAAPQTPIPGQPTPGTPIPVQPAPPLPTPPVPAPEDTFPFPLEVAWTTPLGGAIAVPPVYDDERAYLGLRNGKVAAVSLTDGMPVWEFEDAEGPTALSVGANHLVITRGLRLEARNAASGVSLWHRELEAPIACPPVVVAGWVLVSLENTSILALQADSGNEVWSIRLPTTVNSSPTVVGNRVYVGLVNGVVTALDIETGNAHWTREFGGALGPMLPLDNKLYVGAKDNFFYCLNERDGRVLWRWRTGADIIGIATADDERIYFVSLDNLLRAVSRANGNQRWKRALPSRATGGPLLIGERLIAAGVTPILHGYNARDGRLAARFGVPTESVLAAAPHLVGESTSSNPLIIVPLGDGTLVAVRAQPEAPPPL